MRKKYTNIIIIVFSLTIFVLLFIKKKVVIDSVFNSLNIFIASLLPSLFPFFVISDILINYNFINYIPKFIKNILLKIFNISDNALFILIISMFSGFPNNGRNICNLYKKGGISKKECEHLLLFNHFCNPLFIINVIPNLIGIDYKYAYIILIVHYLSNFIIGYLFRKKNVIIDYNLTNNSSKYFSKVFINSINKSIDGVISILGILTIFLVISSLINCTFNLPFHVSFLISSMMEITSGISNLSLVNVSIEYKIIMVCCLLAFGGFSIYMQVYNEISDTDISFDNYFLGRMIQVVISLILSYFICLFTF